jgi:transposase
MSKYTLPDTELSDLREAHSELREKRDADRVKAIILLGSGWSATDVAEALLIDRNTIRSYYRKYKKGGLDKLLQTKHVGSASFLSVSQANELDEYLQENLHLTAKSVAAYIKKRWQVCYSERGVTALLHRLGYVYKKPKLIPGKANAKAQLEFLEKYEQLKQDKQPDDLILFMDGVHPQHNPVMACGWIKRGVEFPIKSNTGRQRLNVNGAVNIDSLETVCRFYDTINGAATIDLCKAIEEHDLKAGSIYIICDNARYYRSKEVRQFLETSRIELLFLPPYAPNLNLIERYWKYFKKVILYNHYYETFKEFKIACENFFSEPEKHVDNLRPLLTENFQIIGA